MKRNETAEPEASILVQLLAIPFGILWALIEPALSAVVRITSRILGAVIGLAYVFLIVVLFVWLADYLQSVVWKS